MKATVVEGTVFGQDCAFTRANPVLEVGAAIRDEKNATSDPAAGGAQTQDKRCEAGSSVQLQTRCGWRTFPSTFASTVPSISEATR